MGSLSGENASVSQRRRTGATGCSPRCAGDAHAGWIVCPIALRQRTSLRLDIPRSLSGLSHHQSLKLFGQDRHRLEVATTEQTLSAQTFSGNASHMLAASSLLHFDHRQQLPLTDPAASRAKPDQN